MTSSYSSEFKKAAEWILKAEGGYVHNALDAGGATKYGISLRYLQRKGKAGDINGDDIVDTRDIRAFSPIMAKKLYYSDFWLPCGCDKLPFPLALILFDMAVNSGPKKATMLLQGEANAKMDGIIGPKTIHAIHQHNTRELALHYLSRRALHYHDIVQSNSSQAIFLRGWLNRLFLLYQFIHLEGKKHE